mmetsp:Transcript_13942/g.28811  ORF Transcript_13942/g.28811 Transcript_13942/m.28811 type:complete len:112 (-) Transcript_13942:2499-2834(-)
MAGEAEFAFLVAGFGLSEGLLTTETYASVVFAILLSTIVSPVLLQSTLSVFSEEPSETAEGNNPLNTPDEEEEKKPNSGGGDPESKERSTNHGGSSIFSTGNTPEEIQDEG